jgi:Fe(3+) dicitrate transport protein
MPVSIPRRLLVLAISAALNPVVAANSQETRLPRIDVIGEVETDSHNIAGSAAIIDSQALEEMQPLSTQDALKSVAGVSVREEEGYGFIPNIGLRGLNPNRSQKILVLEDGVPVAPSLFLDNASYYSPRIERMERIEVLKGASSLRYGPSTIGGTINYISKDPLAGNSATFKLGTHGYRSAEINAGASAGDAFGGISLIRAQGDGLRDNGFDMSDFMLKTGMAIGDKHLLSAKFSWYDNEINTSYVGLRPLEYQQDHSRNAAPDDYFLTNRFGLDINHEAEFSDNISLNTLLYWSRLERDYWRRDVIGRSAEGTTFRPCDGSRSCTGGRTRTFDMLGMDSRLALAHHGFGIPNQAEIGVRLHREKLDSRTIGGFTPSAREGVLSSYEESSADSIALYAQNRFDVNEQVALTPGVRVEHYRQARNNLSPQNPANRSSGKTDNTEIMPGLGLTWQAAPSAQIFAGVYRGFAPAIVATAISSTGVDQQLEAERSTNLEIGVRGKHGDFFYEAAAFRMDFANQITPQTESGGITQTNAGETLNQGLELSAGTVLGQSFSLEGNMTWLATAKYMSVPLTGANTYGNRLVYAPEITANLALVYRHDDWLARLAANHVSSQFSDAANTVVESADGRVGEIPAYTVLNLSGGYQVTDKIRLFASVYNLTDKKYIAGRHPDGIFPGTERSVQAGVKVSF